MLQDVRFRRIMIFTDRVFQTCWNTLSSLREFVLMRHATFWSVSEKMTGISTRKIISR